MKGFNLANVGGNSNSQPGLASSTPSLAGSSLIPALANTCSRASMQTLDETSTLAAATVDEAHSNIKGNPLLRSPITKLAQLARLAGAKKADSKKKWGNLIEAAKSAKGVSRMWTRSRSRSEDSVSSDGSGGATAQTVDDSNTLNRREKYTKSRTGYPVVHVTENELPEVLEESGIDYELSGRMGMESVKDTHSPTTNLRRFRRACSEPADQVTLILEEESTEKNNTEHLSKIESYACSGLYLAATRPTRAAEQSGNTNTVNLRFRRCGDFSSPITIPTPVKSQEWMAGQNLPDNQILPFVDDSADTYSGCSPIETVFKSLNGVLYGLPQTIVSGDNIYNTQPLGQHPSGGWL